MQTWISSSWMSCWAQLPTLLSVASICGKGGKFLKKCGAAVVGEDDRVILYYQLSWWCKLATVKFQSWCLEHWPFVSFETLCSVQFMLSTQLIILNYPKNEEHVYEPTSRPAHFCEWRRRSWHANIWSLTQACISCFFAK